MQRIEKQVIAYTSICHALDHILELTYGVVLIDIAREFGAGIFALGVLANIAGFAFGLTALPAGFLTDRIGERRLLMLFCLSSGLAAIAVAFSPNIYVLGVGLGVLGTALGIYHPSGSALVAKGTRHVGIAFGYVGVIGNLGMALGPFLAGIIASQQGWRAPYIIFAIPTLAMAALLYSFSRKEFTVVTKEATNTNLGKTSPQATLLPLALVIIAGTMNGFVYRGLVTFLPLYLSQRVQFSLFNISSIALAGSFTTIVLGFGTIGQFLSGHLSERGRKELLALLVAVAMIPPLLLMGNSQGAILILGAIVFAFFYFMGQPIYNSLIAEYSPATWQGRSYGMYFFFSFGIGSFSASFLGYIAEKLGTNWVFIAMAGIAVVTTGTAIALLVQASSVARKMRQSELR